MRVLKIVGVLLLVILGAMIWSGETTAAADLVKGIGDVTAQGLRNVGDFFAKLLS